MKKQKLIIIILIFFISIFVIPIILLSPSGNDTSSKWDYYIEPEIFTASEEVNINGIIYTLDTYMWRDFMPISPPGGKPLIAIIKIYAFGEENFPSSIKVERLWLINGGVIILALPTEEYSVKANTLEMVFRDGPKWEPGILIDVVVKLNGMNLGSYYLKAVNQLINATM